MNACSILLSLAGASVLWLWGNHVQPRLITQPQNPRRITGDGKWGTKKNAWPCCLFVKVEVLLMEGKENRKTAKKKKSRYVFVSGDQTFVSATLVLASCWSLERELIQELWGGRRFKSLSKVLWEPVSLGSYQSSPLICYNWNGSDFLVVWPGDLALGPRTRWWGPRFLVCQMQMTPLYLLHRGKRSYHIIYSTNIICYFYCYSSPKPGHVPKGLPLGQSPHVSSPPSCGTRYVITWSKGNPEGHSLWILYQNFTRINWRDDS